MNFYSVAPFIQQYYPKYYSIETYPADKCVCIRKVAEEWGIWGNFARTRIIINKVKFKNSEQLFQLMKFQMASSQDNRVMCEVTENNNSVSIAFGKDVKYLGTGYTKRIGLYGGKNQLKFDTAVDVVSYLCSHWDWKQ